ncbi:helix-turn-helix transcriptional regulator [Streptomyces sp. NPDC006261]
MSQAEPAERCGMKQPQISRIEGGGTMPAIPSCGAWPAPWKPA